MVAAGPACMRTALLVNRWLGEEEVSRPELNIRSRLRLLP
jgi:hypothetical protein